MASVKLGNHELLGPLLELIAKCVGGIVVKLLYRRSSRHLLSSITHYQRLLVVHHIRLGFIT